MLLYNSELPYLKDQMTVLEPCLRLLLSLLLPGRLGVQGLESICSASLFYFINWSHCIWKGWLFNEMFLLIYLHCWIDKSSNPQICHAV